MIRLKNFFSTSMGQIFLAAFFLRIFLAPFFFHPDMKTIYYNSHFLSFGVVNIYDFLAKNPDKSQLGAFPYPPLTYFFYGILYFPLKVILDPGFPNWLSMGNDATAVPNLFRYLFFMKLPLFVFEFLVGFLIIKILKNEKEIKRALLFWFFNPANIYSVVLMGQFDIIPASLTVLALYLSIYKRKAVWGAIVLGMGGALKTYPLLLLPFLSLISVKGLFKQLKVFVLGLFPYLLFVLPFLGSAYFRQSSFASGLSQRLFLLNLDIGFEEQILLVIFLIVFLFLLADWKKESGESLIGYFLAVPLIVLAGSHFHPQWLIWVTPFLALAVGKCKKLILPAVFLLIGWLGTIMLFNDKFLTWGLISPFDTGVFFLPPLRELLAGFFPPILLQSLFHTLFSACAIWISILAINNKLDEK